MDPSQPPMTTLGKSSARMILGGRFLQSDYQGEMMGMPFHGVGIDGYDRIQKRFVSVWMDTMGTMIMTLQGELDDSGKVLTMETEYLDPMTRKRTRARTVTTIVSDDEHTFDYYAPGPDGKMFRAMAMVYSRR
jgi:hypothetical protein